MIKSLSLLQKALYDVVSSKPNYYIFENTQINNSRIFDLINNDEIPTADELYKLVSIISVDVLDTVYKELFPDCEDKELYHFVNLYLAQEIQKEREKRGYTWDQLDSKYGYTKQAHQKLLIKTYGKPTTKTLNRLVGFLPEETLIYVKNKLHSLDKLQVLEGDQLSYIATVDDFISKASIFNDKDRLKIIETLIADFDSDTKLRIIQAIVC